MPDQQSPRITQKPALIHRSNTLQIQTSRINAVFSTPPDAPTTNTLYNVGTIILRLVLRTGQGRKLRLSLLVSSIGNFILHIVVPILQHLRQLGTVITQPPLWQQTARRDQRGRPVKRPQHQHQCAQLRILQLVLDCLILLTFLMSHE